MQYVVFGADGYIGSYLFSKLNSDNKNVVGTSRRKKLEGKIYFDIRSRESFHFIERIKDEEKTAIICIAEPGIDKCFEEYEFTYNINVIKTRELIQMLRENNFHVIFFSTDNVFDGKEGKYTEGSPTHALNRYGQMKEEMEGYLLTDKEDICIFRIPKVVAAYRDRHNIFSEWERQATTGIIRCIKDNRISFVCIEDVYNACVLAAERKMHGLYHIVGERDYSREELAKKFFDKCGVADIKIIEANLEDFQFKDCRPLNISMSNLKFKQETGYQFMAMDTVIERYIKTGKEEI